MTCLTCKYRAPFDATKPQADATLYRCIRMPQHAILDLSKLMTHTCGEYEVIEYENLVRYVLTHGH